MSQTSAVRNVLTVAASAGVMASAVWETGVSPVELKTEPWCFFVPDMKGFRDRPIDGSREVKP